MEGILNARWKDCVLLLAKKLIKNVSLELKYKDLRMFSPAGMEGFHDTNKLYIKS